MHLFHQKRLKLAAVVFVGYRRSPLPAVIFVLQEIGWALVMDI